MLLPHGTVFAVVDGENFELFRNTATEAKPELTPMEVPRLEATNYSSAFHEHDKISRFTLGAPKDRDAKLEEGAHAVAVAEWLNAQVLAHKISKLVIVADPRSLGAMRRRYHKKLKEVLLGDLPRRFDGARAGEIVKALHAT